MHCAPTNIVLYAKYTPNSYRMLIKTLNFVRCTAKLQKQTIPSHFLLLYLPIFIINVHCAALFFSLLISCLAPAVAIIKTMTRR